MPLATSLDALQARVRRSVPLQRFAVLNRMLLAIAFVPPGMVKVLGQRFTTLPVETPVGRFFEAMYLTGWYWNFLGWSQVLAGACLLVPRLAPLGAMLFLPIIVNICALTNSIGFGGTDVLTVFMLLAALYLVLWEYDRWKGLLPFDTGHHAQLSWTPLPTVASRRLELLAVVLFVAGGMAVFFWTRSLFPRAALFGAIATVAVVAPLCALSAWWLGWRATRLASRAG